MGSVVIAEDVTSADEFADYVENGGALFLPLRKDADIQSVNALLARANIRQHRAQGGEIGVYVGQYRDSHAPYLSLTPKEYFQRNCWAAVEGSEPEIEATASLIGADRMCISTDYPHFDSNFPNVSNNLLANVSRDTAAQVLMGGAHLYGFTEEHFAKAALAADRRQPAAAD